MIAPPTMALSTGVRLNVQLTKLIIIFNMSAVNQLQTALTKKLKSLSLFASIINPTNRNGYGAQGWPLFLWCALSLWDWLYQWCTPSLQGYYLSLGEYQAYKTYYLYFESTPSLQSLSKLPKTCSLPDCVITHNNQIARPLSTKVERVQGYYLRIRASIFRFSSPVLC